MTKPIKIVNFELGRELVSVDFVNRVHYVGVRNEFYNKNKELVAMIPATQAFYITRIKPS